MEKNFVLVKINANYCNYLRKYDNKVPYNEGRKELRPFVGVIFKIEEICYFAPLTSPKNKHLVMKNKLDFLKINNGIYGAINFNNMIPVIDGTFEIIDLAKKFKDKEENMYQQLLINQLNWLNDNNIKVRTKAIKLYTLYNENRLPLNIKNRCCNFKLLEEKCTNYNKEKLVYNIS